MNATEWIAQRRELATEGPWRWGGASWEGVLITGHGRVIECSQQRDAASVLDSLTSLPTALDALEAAIGATGPMPDPVWPSLDWRDGFETAMEIVEGKIEAALRGEKPTAWSCTCAAGYHDAPMSFDVAGDTNSAIRAARAAGWKPCHEVAPLLSKSMLSWWCPECVARFTAARKTNRKDQP